jgi:hypothetical protein
VYDFPINLRDDQTHPDPKDQRRHEEWTAV